MTHGFDKEKKEMRTTYPLITRNDPTPKKLKQQTLDGMVRRRQERERRKARRKKITMRVTATAAILAVAVAATPLRGHVVNAAQNAYRAVMANWKENIFPVAIRQTDKGCTVEIIESRTSNEFLYLTVKESYQADMVTKDSETMMYHMPDISYSGKVSDDKGHQITFDGESVLCLWAVSSDHANYIADYDKRVITQEKGEVDEEGIFSVNIQYKVYLPGLGSLINSADKKYSCTLRAESQQTGSKMAFEFPLDKVDDVLESKRYPINREYTLKGASVTLENMQLSHSEADLVVRIDPDQNLSAEVVDDLVEHLEMSVHAQCSGMASGVLVFDTYGRQNGSVLDLDEDVNADAIMRDKPMYIHRDGHYYFVLSDGADVNDDSYDMDQMTQGEITVEVETLRWNSRMEGFGDQLSNSSGSIEDIVLRAAKKGEGHYNFDENHIVLKGSRGNLDINLLGVKEKKTVKLKKGKYKHILTADAEITLSNWDSMAKDGTWENMTLVNGDGEEILVVSLQVETMGSSSGSGTFAPFDVKCEVVDSNKHFELKESNLDLHVAKVEETQTYEANAWFNPKYCGEGIADASRETVFTLNPAS